MSASKKNLFILNLLLFLTFGLMLLGSVVRTQNAGLACPDWPLCFGKIIPKYHFGVYLEFIHRVIAGLVGIIYFIFFIQVLRKPEFRKIRMFSFVGLFLLVAQMIMGGLTVLRLLKAVIVTFHLGLATAFLFVLFLMKKILEENRGTNPVLNKCKTSFYFKTTVAFCLFFVFIQIILGGLVASTYSGIVCVDFPTCNGQYFPPLKGPIGIQMLHRFGAYLLGTLIVTLFVLSVFCSKTIGLNQSQRVMTIQIFFLIFSQMFLGVMNLKYLMPPFLSVLHLTVALIIFISLLHLFLSVTDLKF